LQPQAQPSSPRAALTPTAPANPVGDVHERIRRMLMEGSEEAPLSSRTAPPQRRAAEGEERAQPKLALKPAEGADALRNPFREAQDIGKAALDMFKSLGGASRPQSPMAERESPAPRPQQPLRGDLFDDDADAELEIPSFLRKKKTGS
jgi:cell division protein FtsZ